MKKKQKLTQEEWLETIGQGYQKKHNTDPSELNHIRDFFQANPSFRVSTYMSYPVLKAQADRWTKKLNERNKNLKESGRTELAYEFDEGLRLVRLANQKAKDWEGKHMGHCVSSYAQHEGIYSLRDDHQIPHCTLEISRGKAVQIKGRANKEVVARYHPMVLKSLEILECQLTSVDLKNIGYHVIPSPLLKTLRHHFTGLLEVECEGKLFINYSSKLILVKPIVEFNQGLWDLLVNHLDCPPAFKQLFQLTPSKDIKLEDYASILNRFLVTTRLGMVKTLVPLIPNKPQFFCQHTDLICSAVKGNNLELVKYIYEQQTKALNLIDNTYLKAVDWDIFKYCVDDALANNNSEILTWLLNNGAKVAPKRVYDHLKEGLENNNLKIVKVLLPLNVAINDKSYFDLVKWEFKRSKAEVLLNLLKVRNITQELMLKLFKLWSEENQENSNRVILTDYLLETYLKEKFDETMDLIIRFGDIEPNLQLNQELGSINKTLLSPSLLVLALKYKNKSWTKFLLQNDQLLKVDDWNKICDDDFFAAVPVVVRDISRKQQRDFLTMSVKLNFNKTIQELRQLGVISEEEQQAKDEEFRRRVKNTTVMADGRVRRIDYDEDGYWEDQDGMPSSLLAELDKIERMIAYRQATTGRTDPELVQFRKELIRKVERIKGSRFGSRRSWSYGEE